MILNYIILAHKNPTQLERLVDRLNEPWVNFYIHVDKNVNIKPFEIRLERFNNISFLKNDKRHTGIWGDIGIVEATLDAMSIIASKNNEGYCILLTGQDYPIQSNIAIKEYFIKQDGSNFISIYQTPDSWTKPYKDRIKKYKINKSSKRGHFLLLSSIYDKSFYHLETLGKLNFLRKTGNYTAIKKVFKKRGFPKYLQAYGGGVYFALTLDTIKKILKFHDEHPDFLEYNSYTLCADEVYFHSIIMTLYPKEQLKIAPSLTYVNWDKKGVPLPVTFTIEDYEELEGASKNFLWARKFDTTKDESVLDKIDNSLLA